MQEFKYTINGKNYTQRPLVLGQVQQLITTLKMLYIPKDIDTAGIIVLLGNKLSRAIAIVLIPENVNLKDKDIDALAEEIEFSISPEITLQVVDDFFVCNPIISLLEKLTGTINLIDKLLPARKNGSSNSAVPSQEEILQNGTQSSGDTPSASAAHISDTGSAN